MPAPVKLLYSLLFFLITFLVINPSFTLAQKNGFLVKTGLGSFYIPSFRSTAFLAFPKFDHHLKGLVEGHIKDSPFEFGIVIKNFTTGQEYNLNENKKFKAASLYKMMLMETIYDLASKDKFDITFEIERKIENMVQVSNNEDAWYLAELVGWNTIGYTMKDLGLRETTMDNPPITTPKDISHFLELLHKNKLVSKHHSELMKNLMFGQKINDRIPKLLPKDTKVAHKTGEYEEVRHDVGIVSTANNTYSIILMSKNVTIENEVYVKEIIARISKDVYDYFENQWQSPPRIL